MVTNPRKAAGGRAASVLSCQTATRPNSARTPAVPATGRASSRSTVIPLHTAQPLHQVSLDSDVGKTDTECMASPARNEGSAFTRLFGSWGASRSAVPPRPAAPAAVPVRAVAAALAAADPQALATGDMAEIQEQIHAILAASQRRSLAEFAAGPVATDGGIVIDSMSAVFACSVVNSTMGGGVLSRLAGNSRRDDFVSTRALAALLIRLRTRRAA
jgi:hypothetical protein